ncbi:MAG: AMP-binding protein [Chloroflexi bacterium]|nr:AMP-binding protein [Chloroflexota bacterium]
MTDYESVRRSFRLEVPAQYDFVTDVIERWAADRAKLAMLWVGPDGEERRLTFAWFAERAARFANALAGAGVAPGDTVFAVLPRVPEWWETFLGSVKGGYVFAPGTTLLTVKDLVYRLDASETRAVITDAENAAKVDEALASIDRPIVHICTDRERPAGWLQFGEELDRASARYGGPRHSATDPSLVFFTSGTTGLPKMVLHTQASYGIGHEVTGRYWLDNTPADLHWTISDTGWAQAAWSCVFGPWRQGAAVFIKDSRGRFDPMEALEMLARHPITTFFAPPTAYRLLVREPLSRYRFPALRHTTGAGEPVNPELVSAWREGTGFTIYECYGQTETALLTAVFPGMEVRLGSMGVAAPGYELGIVDEEGRLIPDGTEGDLAVRVVPDRPIGMFREYWKNPGATAGCHRGDWYITFDRAIRDADGYHWFVGRSDDVIISAGYRIGPFEVESALLEHPAVVESAVIAHPDEARGNIVKAYVVLGAGHTPSPALTQQLQDHVKRVTAPYKYPREIAYVADLPKTISGKIRRGELRLLDRAEGES